MSQTSAIYYANLVKTTLWLKAGVKRSKINTGPFINYEELLRQLNLTLLCLLVLYVDIMIEVLGEQTAME